MSDAKKRKPWRGSDFPDDVDVIGVPLVPLTDAERRELVERLGRDFAAKNHQLMIALAKK